MRRFFTIHINVDNGEAEVKPSSSWDEWPGLLKADILSDLKHDFSQLYDKALEEWREEMKIVRDNAKTK